MFIRSYLLEKRAERITQHITNNKIKERYNYLTHI